MGLQRGLVKRPAARRDGFTWSGYLLPRERRWFVLKEREGRILLKILRGDPDGVEQKMKSRRSVSLHRRETNVTLKLEEKTLVCITHTARRHKRGG